ncbi:MAG: chromosomal replication initiator protein DnaA [Patescibacteria group bacterium]
MSALKEKWLQAKELFQSTFPANDYAALFSSLEFVTISNQGKKLIIATPTAYHKEKILNHYSKLLEQSQKLYNTINQIEIEVNSNLLQAPVKVEEVKPLIDENQQGVVSFLKVDKTVSKDRFLNNLNPKYTFGNYLVCGYNEFLSGVAYEVVNNPGVSHNPMFVYSPVGLGKTHISQAIGHSLIEKFPSWNIKYVPAETFKQQFVFYSQQNKRQEFIDSFLEIDLLILDDVQSLANAEGTQAIFFQIFNQMYQNNKQIVITSDRAPFSLNGFTDRLISRFNSGIVVDIQTPDYEDRMALLKFKIDKANVNIQSNLITEIADNIDYSVREIESVVNTIKAKKNLYPDRDLTIDDLNYLTNSEEKIRALPAYRKDTVRALLPSKIHSRAEKSEEILENICKVFSISKEDITGSSRLANIAKARQFCAWALKQKTNLTLQNIGLYLGNRSHATILHAVKKVESDLRKRKSIFKEYISVLDFN